MTPAQAKQKYGATHYVTMKDGVTPQMYYKLGVRCEVSDLSPKLYYLTFCNLWHGASIAIDSPKLIKIEDAA